MNLNVKQVAEQLHISERAVQKKFLTYENELKEYLKFVNNHYEFDIDGLELLRNVGKYKRHNKANHEPKNEQSSLDLINEYKFLINSYKEQITALKNENEALKKELNLKWYQRLLPHKSDRN